MNKSTHLLGVITLLHQLHQGNITAHYYYTVLHTFSIVCIIVSIEYQLNLLAYFRGSLGVEVFVSVVSQLSVSALQKQEARSRTSPMGGTMIAPTIPNDARRLLAVVVVQEEKRKRFQIINTLQSLSA